MLNAILVKWCEQAYQALFGQDFQRFVAMACAPDKPQSGTIRGYARREAVQATMR
jgi:hypothetical protein